MNAASVKSWLLDRLSENSTYRGLIQLAAAFGIYIAPDMETALMALAFAIIGVINVMRKAPG